MNVIFILENALKPYPFPTRKKFDKNANVKDIAYTYHK
jgi:hypothetical protein